MSLSSLPRDCLTLFKPSTRWHPRNWNKEVPETKQSWKSYGSFRKEYWPFKSKPWTYRNSQSICWSKTKAQNMTQWTAVMFSVTRNSKNPNRLKRLQSKMKRSLNHKLAKNESWVGHQINSLKAVCYHQATWKACIPFFIWSQKVITPVRHD